MAKSSNLAFFALLGFIWCGVQGKPFSENVNVEGYYWRDYIGEIPHDAIEGGPDANGDTMYIGQTTFTGLHGAILVPGQINAENQSLIFEWGKRERTTYKNIKVLCSDHPERFEWLRTSTDDIIKLKNASLVLGGFEGDYTVYIGRVMSGGELTIAKVNVANDKALLHATKDGNDDYHHYFEILNYNPHIPSVEKIIKSVERKLYDHVPTNSGFKFMLPYSSFSLIFAVLLFMF